MNVTKLYKIYADYEALVKKGSIDPERLCIDDYLTKVVNRNVLRNIADEIDTKLAAYATFGENDGNT